MGAVSICVLVLLLAAAPASARPTAESFRPACPTLRQLGEASLEAAGESLQAARGEEQAVALYRARNGQLRQEMIAGASEACRRGLEALAERVLWHEGIWARDPGMNQDLGQALERSGFFDHDPGDFRGMAGLLEKVGTIAAGVGAAVKNAGIVRGGAITAAIGALLDLIAPDTDSNGRGDGRSEHEPGAQR